MSTIAWGNVPEWLAGIGTVGSLWAGYRLLRREANRDEERATDRRREQASKVTIWRGKRPLGPPGSIKAGHHEAVLLVDNASDRPIFDVIVAYVDGTRAPDDSDAWLGTEALDVLPPGERKHLTIPHRHLERHGDAVRGVVMFTDSNDRRWRRDPRGELHDFQADGRPAIHWWHRFGIGAPGQTSR